MSKRVLRGRREGISSSGMTDLEAEPIRIPERSTGEWGTALLLFAASCPYLRVFYDYTNMNGDEGIVLQGAQRILNGEILYRDLFSFLPLGSYYWMTFLFKIFGSSILMARADSNEPQNA